MDPDNYNFSTKLLLPKDVDMIIYHGKCMDGYSAALACYIFNNRSTENIIFHPAYHGQSPPDVKNKNVLICDFSYKKHFLALMMTQVKTLLILDHHISAKNELDFLPDENKVFDKK